MPGFPLELAGTILMAESPYPYREALTPLEQGVWIVLLAAKITVATRPVRPVS